MYDEEHDEIYDVDSTDYINQNQDNYEWEQISDSDSNDKDDWKDDVKHCLISLDKTPNSNINSIFIKNLILSRIQTSSLYNHNLNHIYENNSKTNKFISSSKL
ncbi:uncharacterized protein KGF55_002883 [Candida pseudojiufengensis]|uniref:uncharacterized protein n=1 Tax=Candida pseudojiufengensis TaxID=497109 RepID=UPI0022257C95|nr:uncharacterized protein KGF55_002883 [Candida pseudojiufengensis]KAI5963091.1 hypothetical protein KGF55_002883 [Candida pseudojiufengensis]